MAISSSSLRRLVAFLARFAESLLVLGRGSRDILDRLSVFGHNEKSVVDIYISLAEEAIHYHLLELVASLFVRPSDCRSQIVDRSIALVVDPGLISADPLGLWC